MKRKMLIRMAFVLLFAGMATSSKAQSLNEIFGNIKDQVGNLINQVTVTETSILGKWTYLHTRTAISVPVIAAPERTNLTTLSRDAPAITGMARKKVNSATQARDRPSSRPPTMVAPERL